MRQAFCARDFFDPRPEQQNFVLIDAVIEITVSFRDLRPLSVLKTKPAVHACLV
jgi:hypothetical protein